MKNRPLIIGITGGTGSGKSTVCKTIIESVPKENIAIIEQDAYYKDQSHIPFEERLKTNYDHPLAFDNDLLITHLNELVNGKSIEKPVYDFEKHTRKLGETVTINPKDIIVVEGIMILEDKRLRSMLDIKIFVDTDNDIRILRRLQRDIEERGRTVESVIDQYLTTVRPAHMQFIEPYKRYADIIIPEGGYNEVAIDIVVAKLISIIESKVNKDV
ncbi:uridine kinase [Tepidibacter formicigenes]|jgi:uridine kinase|uniref:Uridine kinase n=1 Tax=Tepidibacter formicigenes DSM 15518 TaxID=1123349 RepID=A0A1M6L042_9FIRM|nr:uridine kinase [Tepidibacter formicigenes]SHJ64494.1 uridine kinase [Tepidibacter formicigenes DSM 15518]